MSDDMEVLAAKHRELIGWGSTKQKYGEFGIGFDEGAKHARAESAKEIAAKDLEILRIEACNDTAREIIKDKDAEIERLKQNLPPLNSDLEQSLEEARKEIERLRQVVDAARAVVEHWETPNWKQFEPTAGFIYVLRDTLAAAEKGNL